MSLEQALAENTAAIRALIAAMTVQGATHAEVGTAVHAAVDKVNTKGATGAPKKSEKAPASESTRTASDSSKTSTSESTEASAPAVEYKQIQQLVPQIAKTPEGTEMVVALFARYGVKRGPELKAEQYDAFYADLVKLQAGEYDPRTAEA